MGNAERRNYKKPQVKILEKYAEVLSGNQARRMFPDSAELHNNKNTGTLDEITKETGELFVFLRKEQQKHTLQRKAEEEKKRIEQSHPDITTTAHTTRKA